MTASPGRIQSVMTRPPGRDAADFRTTAEFQQLRRDIQHLLRAAHEEANS
jgi:hypothetical protein